MLMSVFACFTSFICVCHDSKDRTRVQRRFCQGFLPEKIKDRGHSGILKRLRASRIRDTPSVEGGKRLCKMRGEQIGGLEHLSLTLVA